MKTSLRLRRALVGAAAFIFAGTLLTACSKNDDEMPQVDASGLMAFNLATDKPSVGFSLSGSWLTNTGLSFNSYTGGYLAVYTGARSVDAFDFLSGASMASVTNTFEKDKYYSAFAIGANGTYRNILVQDDFDAMNTDGTAYIRYINAIPDSSFPTVTVTREGNSIASSQPHFGTISTFTAVEPGDVTIAMNNSGAIQKNRTFAVESRKVYTVLLAGTPGSTGADSLQIRYVLNGTLDGTSNRSSSSQNRSMN